MSGYGVAAMKVAFCTAPTSIKYECERCEIEFDVPGDFDYDYGAQRYFFVPAEVEKCPKCKSCEEVFRV
jgi:NAD-dependent dihydropyrimidine dehydrogenase PreA subunit